MRERLLLGRTRAALPLIDSSRDDDVPWHLMDHGRNGRQCQRQAAAHPAPHLCILLRGVHIGACAPPFLGIDETHELVDAQLVDTQLRDAEQRSIPGSNSSSTACTFSSQMPSPRHSADLLDSLRTVFLAVISTLAITNMLFDDRLPGEPQVPHAKARAPSQPQTWRVWRCGDWRGRCAGRKVGPLVHCP